MKFTPNIHVALPHLAKLRRCASWVVSFRSKKFGPN